MKFAWRPKQDLFHPVSINHLGHKTKMFVLIIIFFVSKASLQRNLFFHVKHLKYQYIYSTFQKENQLKICLLFSSFAKIEKKMKFQWNVHVFNPKIIIFWLNNLSCISFTHKIRIDMIVFVHTCKYNLPSSFSI